METELRLRQWLEAARTGDEEATRGVERIVRQIAQQVAGGRTGTLLRGVDWEDVAQEALLRLASGGSGYRGTGSARGYIYSTVKTSLLQTLRGTRRRERREEDYSSGAGDAVREEEIHESRRRAEEALAALDPGCRKLVEQVFLGGVSYARLSKESGTAESSVRARLSRCLRRARERAR